MEKVIIIGSGPAAHTAAIYTSRAQLHPILYEGLMAGGVAAGGQLTTTTEVENFPGFPKGITGPALMQSMREQSIGSGCRIETKTVSEVRLNVRPFIVVAEKEEIKAQAIIIATGATAKRMGVPGEETYWQKGISACAVCDGALPIFRNKTLVVIGGGDSACEEANFLTKYAEKVLMVHRRDKLRASKTMQERVLKNEKIEVCWNSQLESAFGEGEGIGDDRKKSGLLGGVRLSNTQTGETKEVYAGGLFYAIGHIPNTSFLDGQIELDETGYIAVNPGTTITNVSGVFAAGDVQDKIYRQAITAAGSGCMAAMDLEKFLESQGES